MRIAGPGDLREKLLSRSLRRGTWAAREKEAGEKKGRNPHLKEFGSLGKQTRVEAR